MQWQLVHIECSATLYGQEYGQEEIHRHSWAWLNIDRFIQMLLYCLLFKCKIHLNDVYNTF